MRIKFLVKKTATRLMSFFHASSNGPVICVAMVRNESDIVQTWARHLAALFDRIIIYDHMSNDGTEEKLSALAAAHPAIEIRKFMNPALDQSGLMTQVLHEIRDSEKAGWLFFLDADEFIAVQDRKKFRKELSHYRAAQSVILRWCNIYPTERSGISECSVFSGWSRGPVFIRKIAINLRYAENIVKVAQGNHGVAMKSKRLLSKVPMLSIFHMPIRTESQLKSKVKYGSEANSLLEDGENYSTHWREMSRMENFCDVRSLVYNYGFIPKGQTMLSQRQPPLEDISGTLLDYCAFPERPGPEPTPNG